MTTYYVVMFVVMVLVGMLFNPMNVLAYRTSDLYVSLTLFYSGLLMASNMVWSHELIHYMTTGHMNGLALVVGIVLAVIVSFVLRNQLFVDEKQWLRRMIAHHSTAITTTEQLLRNNPRVVTKPKIHNLAREILHTQEKEIAIMKSLL